VTVSRDLLAKSCGFVCREVVAQIFAQAQIAAHQSSRASRALDRDKVFNSSAGALRVPGASLDKHGNVAGAENELGRLDAFKGLKTVVIQQYREVQLNVPTFDFRYPRAALEVCWVLGSGSDWMARSGPCMLSCSHDVASCFCSLVQLHSPLGIAVSSSLHSRQTKLAQLN
jgi:hypothetical protein